MKYGLLPVTRRSSRGMAIVVALVFAFCLMIMVFGIFKTGRSSRAQTKLSLIKAQASFAARSAMQHFLLKAKLFPTELYDGVEFSEGKNPLFDFTEFENGAKIEGQEFTFEKRPELGNKIFTRVLPSQERDSAGQFKYYYVEVPGKTNIFMRLAGKYYPDYRFIGGLLPADLNLIYTHRGFNDPSRTHKRYAYLDYYLADCTNDPKWQPGLHAKISSKVTSRTAWSLADADDFFPFTMDYRVKSITVQAIQGLRRYNEEAIKIVVEGTATNMHKEQFTQELAMVQKITRKGALNTP